MSRRIIEGKLLIGWRSEDAAGDRRGKGRRRPIRFLGPRLYLRLSGGEADVLRLHQSGRIDLVVSDDRRFLQILEALGIRYTTPGPLIAALSRMGKMPRKEALVHLDKLGAFISEEEYSEAKRAIEEG